ncbi:cytochrome P460 family protein [Sphingosinicella sp. CPCC 101087]|uniref:cytochrome P460 family protein n=1 Tax=Sphingosinicella sp. CPCC 101087 TaxID=2497754 RepID=UPI00101C6C56|nr:cytochrome P460 family protein [Sphingosinicella sp. CPCC 101087]
MRQRRLGPRFVLIVAIAALAAAASTGPGQRGATGTARRGYEPAIAFPQGYRQWTHVKSALLWPSTPENETFSGLHNIYADEAAMTGYRTGTFPERSVIVFDLFDLEAVGGGLEPGRRKSVDVMVRDSSARGGWRFERFREGRPTDRVDDRTRTLCLECHLAERDGDGVFSTFVE